MFAHRFFGAAYFGPAYFGPAAGGGPVVVDQHSLHVFVTVGRLKCF